MEEAGAEAARRDQICSIAPCASIIAAADLNLDLFNGLGTQIGFSPGPAPNKLKKLAVTLEDVGTYFVRVQAAAPKDESDFTLVCTWEEKAADAEPVVRTPPDRRPDRAHADAEPHADADPHAAAARRGEDRKRRRGAHRRVHHEGRATVLYLDKGASAGVRLGTGGWVLEGNSGRRPLDGAPISITKLIDDTHSVARTNALSIGKNNRVVIFVK